LPQPPATLNPTAGDIVKEDSSLTRLIKHFDPRSPEIGEAFGEEDAVKSLPADGVKSFPKVKLEDSSRGGAPMAGLDNIGRIDKVFSD
jgi:hypothetical protein